MTSREILTSLGRGERIADVCAAAKMSREQFDAWWRDETRRRASEGILCGNSEITRDDRGVPHVRAPDDYELFAAYGFVTATDRLFQLDYLRRKALGRL